MDFWIPYTDAQKIILEAGNFSLVADYSLRKNGSPCSNLNDFFFFKFVTHFSVDINFAKFGSMCKIIQDLDNASTGMLDACRNNKKLLLESRTFFSCFMH